MNATVLSLIFYIHSLAAAEVPLVSFPGFTVDLLDTTFMSAIATPGELTAHSTPRHPLNLANSWWFLHDGQTNHSSLSRLQLLNNGRFEIWSAAISPDDPGVLQREGRWTYTHDGKVLFDGYGMQRTGHIHWDGANWRWILICDGDDTLSFEHLMGC